MSSTDHTLELLKQLARRMSGNPDFMAHVLQTYRELEGLDEEALARRLDALPEVVVRLALCKRPNRDSGRFDLQVGELSDFSMITENTLMKVLDRVDGVPRQAGPGWWRLERAFRIRGAAALVEGLAPVFGLIARPTLALVAVSLLILVIVGLVFQRSRPVSRDGLINAELTAGSPENSGSRSTGFPPAPARPTESKRSQLPEGTSREGPGRPSERIAKVTVNLDSEQHTLLRDARSMGREKPIVLAPRRTQFLVKLPSGSSKGAYDVSVVDAYGNPLIGGSSRSADGKSLAIALDMRGLKGKYRLSVSQRDQAPDYYPITVGRDRSIPE